MSAALVASTKAALVAKGQTFTTNEDAFQITCRVAWALRAQGAQLVTKTAAQNGAVYQGVKYSHDVIAFPDGWIDCLASAGPPSNENRPVWNPTGSSNAPLVAPFDLDASAPPVIVPPVLPPPSPDATLEVLTALIDNQEVLMEAVATLRADVTDLKIQTARGLGGTLFGYPIRLKP